ncbi:hypothetical protein BaRGS_00009966, partial [Batillaria attramentaria]
DLSRVKEIRQGRRCVDYEKYPDEANREDSSLCIVVFYGTEALPQSLAVAAKNPEEFSIVFTALGSVVDTVRSQTYQAQRQRWFRRQFEDILGSYPGMTVDDKVTVKQLRGWLLRNSLKVSKKVIHPIQQQLCLGSSFRYGGFMAMVTEIMRIPLFEDFLFSPFNSVWDPAFNTVYQDMTRPLTEYWISSSHNTYLVGNQIKGQSSEEMYASCLRRGCRCLELDCWDGSDGQPIITHGYTLTSKIKVAEVLKVIKENAWLTSEYPIILSIENHLSLAQQRFLARLLKDVFREELLTEPVDPNETKMPSPEQLKRKVIIKDRKLRDKDQETDDSSGPGSAIKSQILMLRFPEESPEYDSDEDEDDLKYQPWYYGSISRDKIKKLLKRTVDNKPPQDGSFLVRDSQGATDSDKYVLSFIWEGELKHVRVKTREENGRTLYTFGNEVWYPSIAELVSYFRTHRLYIADEKRHLYLDKPVCKPMEDIGADWYYPKLDRFGAERLLMRIPQEGAFLVRGSSEPGCLSLSFRHKKKISHFQIYKRGKTYVCGPYRFLSLPKLIDFFHRRPLYRKTKLTVPATESIAEQNVDADCDIYDSLTYCDPSDIQCLKKVSVRALYDFMAMDADQMSFTRGAVITNVREEDKPWWRGDYGDQKQKYFPSNYVQVIADKDDRRPSEIVEGLKGREDTLELKMCTLDPVPYMEGQSGGQTMFYFRLSHGRYKRPLEFGSLSQLQLDEWTAAIRDGQARMGERHLVQQRMEKTQKRARELSDLVVYCQSVTYDPTSVSDKGRHCQVSSLVEDRVNLTDEATLNCSRQQLLRVYPKGTRIKSNNFDPTGMWVLGIQMVALNYQTPDTPMQLNQARFLSNGGCGYVLKPPFLNERYSLADITGLKLPYDNRILSVTVLAGRNLCADGRVMGVVRPFVCVEIIGLPLDNRKSRTKAVDEDNGLNPVWNEEPVKFDVSCPELAFLRFEVLSEVNDSKTTIAQGTFPVTGLRQGYRSVPLSNRYNEPLDMSALLVYIDIKSPKDAEEESLFRVIEEVRRYRAELIASDTGRDARIRDELFKAEKKILDYLQGRRGSEV